MAALCSRYMRTALGIAPISAKEPSTCIFPLAGTQGGRAGQQIRRTCLYQFDALWTKGLVLTIIAGIRVQNRPETRED